MNRIFKQTMALVLAMVMVFSSLAVVSADIASEFSDFPNGWSAEAMEAAVANGLLYGMGDGTIAPKDNLTRAQMAAIINRAFGATVQTDISSFTDVSADSWYYNDVAKAVNMGTFAGISDNSMNPDADITRQEAFAVMARALVLEADDASALSRFGDGSTVASWAISDVCALIERGYVNGYTDGLLCPTANITREEFAQMMHNIIKTYISEPGEVSQVNANDCVMIRTPGVSIHDVKIEGDLILGDGVGRGDVNITNVEIGGRLLCRGGEGKVTLENTTTGEGVVVKDVNGTVNFNNYRSESVFDGVREITPATYLGAGSGTGDGDDDEDGDKIHIGPVAGGSGGSGGTVVPPVTQKHNVVFYLDENCNPADVFATYKIEEGKTLTALPADPDMAGKEFAGWYYKDNGTEKPFTTSVKIYKDIKIFAKWNTTLTFYKDSTLTEQIGEPVIFPYGKTFEEAGMTLPEKPDGETDEEFAGWYYLDENGQEKEFTEDIPVTQNMTIYAKWGVFVTFFDHYNETNKYVGQIGNPIEVIKGESLDKAIFPWDASDDKDDTRQFIGWFYLNDSGAEVEFTETTVVSKTVKVYGKWNTSLTFYEDSGLTEQVGEPVVFPYGKTFEEAGMTLPEKPDGETDEEFAGWYYLDENGREKEFTEDTPVTENMTIYAKWGVFVTFYDHYDDTDKYVGQIGESVVVSKGQHLNKINFPWDESDDKDDTRQFIGWFYLNDSGAEVEFTETTVVSKTVKVYGKWNTSLTFYKDSGLTDVVGSPITVPYGKTLSEAGAALPSISDEGFTGWFYEDKNGQVQEFTVNTPVTENMSIYAAWGMLVTFFDHYDEAYGYAGQIGEPFEVPKGERLEKAKFPWDESDDKDDTRQFIGWFFIDESGAEAEFDETTPVNTQVKVYGKWEVTISLYKDSDLSEPAGNPVTIPYNTATTLDKLPGDGDKEFAGWFYTADDGKVTEFTGTTIVTKNMDVFAKWGIIVTFYDHYDDETEEKYIMQIADPVEMIKGESFADAGKTLPLADESERTHEGWFYLDGEGNEHEFTETTPVDSSLKVYGKWLVVVNFWDGFFFMDEADDDLKDALNEGTYTLSYGATVPESNIPEDASYYGYVKNPSVHSLYTTEEKHMIFTDWWYLNDSDEWVIFDETVEITKNTDVYRMVKNTSFDLEGEIIEKLESKIGEEAYVSIPYSSDTRLNDSVKDLVYSLRSRVEYALTETDAYDKLLEKLSSIKYQIIDADGNILNQSLPVKIIEVINADEIEGEIENYIKTVVEHGGDELRTLLSFVDITELVDAVGVDYIINALDDETLLAILKEENVRPTAVSVLKARIGSDPVVRAEVIGFFTEELQEENSTLLPWFIDFMRTEVNAENQDVISLLAGYLKTALKSNGDLQDMAIPLFIGKLESSEEFRNSIISNDSFLESVLTDPALKPSVVDTIIGHTEFITEVIKDADVRNDIITSLESNDDFVDFIVHHEYFEKEFFKAVKSKEHAEEIEEVLAAHPEMIDEIVKVLMENDEFSASFKNSDGDVHKLIVDQFEKGIADATSSIHKLVIDKAMNTPALRNTLADSNAVKSTIVSRVKTNNNVLKIIRVALEINENDTTFDGYIAEALETYISNPAGSYILNGTDCIPLIDAEIVKIIKGTTDVSDDIKAEIKAELSKYVADHSDDSNVTDMIEGYISDYAKSPSEADAVVKQIVNAAIKDKVSQYLKDDDSDDSADEKKLDGYISAAILDYARAVITGTTASNDDIEEAMHDVKSTCIEGLLHSATGTEAQELLNSFLTDDAHKAELRAAVSSEEGFADIVKYIISHNDNPEHEVVKTGNDFFEDNADSIPTTAIKTYLTAHELDIDLIKTLLVNNIDDIEDSVISGYILGNIGSLSEIIDTFVVTCVTGNKPGFDAIIDDYIQNHLDVATVAKFRSMFTDDPEIAELIKKYVSDDPEGAIEEVISVISRMTEAERVQFVEKVMETLRSLRYYQEFINSFKSGADTFVVNADNISFVMGVATAIRNYTYDSLRDRIRDKFGKVIDFFGEDVVRRYFNNATEDYYNGALAIKNQIEADKLAGVKKDYEYTTSITFKANLMGDILVPKYNEIMSKATQKLDAADKAAYENNPYLKALVEMNLIDEMFDKLPGGSTETLSGYKLKDNPIAYYDFVYALLVLADDAVLYYDVSYDAVVNKLTPYAVRLANKSLELLKEFDEDGSLPGNIDDRINSIDRIKGIYDSIEGIVNAAVDLVIGSPADKDYENEEIKGDAVAAATRFINAFWTQLNEYNESGELPEKLKPALEKSARLKKIFEENKDNIDALVEKIAKLKMNHVYTEEEVAEYEKYVQHLYGMFLGEADPTFSIDTVYEIAEFFADDLMAQLAFEPETVEGYVYIDAYNAGLKGVIGSVVRFLA